MTPDSLTESQRRVLTNTSHRPFGHPSTMASLERLGLVRRDGRRPLVSGRGSLCGTAQEWAWTDEGDRLRRELDRASR